LYFGVPPFTHENNALIAVKAALQLHSSLTRILNDDVWIGVGTGICWLGGVVSSN